MWEGAIMWETEVRRYEVRRHLFPPDATCIVTDHKGRVLYESENNPESAGRSSTLRTTTNLPVAEIHYDLLAPRPTCEIIRDDMVILELREDLYSLAERRFTASGPAGEYELRGDWPNWKILVTRDERPMAEIIQDPSTLSDHYAVDVAPEADLVSILCLAIALHELTQPSLS